jgi:hypothetical protein
VVDSLRSGSALSLPVQAARVGPGDEVLIARMMFVARGLISDFS